MPGKPPDVTFGFSLSLDERSMMAIGRYQFDLLPPFSESYRYWLLSQIDDIKLFKSLEVSGEVKLVVGLNSFHAIRGLCHAE